MKTLLPALVGVALALAQGSGHAEETAPKALKLSIERESLRDALNEWAQQTGYQLVAEIRGDYVAPSVKGRLTAKEALERLIKGTPLTYEWIGERLVAVREKSQVRPASLQTMRAEGEDRTAVRVTKLSDGEWKGGQLVANDFDVTQDASAGPNRASQEAESDVGDLEEIVVTGTHIRGAAPVGSSLIVIDRTAILNSGHGRIRELMEELPQNFSGTSADAFRDAGSANYTRGQAIDLRGLGASGTLILVNGRRQPAGGTQGSFVDISSIATSAVERVELLADGASALYGSDAIGGVVNFVLRKDYQGLETDVRLATNAGSTRDFRVSQLAGQTWEGGNVLLGYQYMDKDALPARDATYASKNHDYRTLGGNDFRRLGGSPGTILDPNTFEAAYAIPNNQNGIALDPAELIAGEAHYEDSVTQAVATPNEKQHSAFVTVSQRLTPAIEMFFEGRYSRREMTFPLTEGSDFFFVPSTNPFYVNPFGNTDDVIVVYSLGKELGILTEDGRSETYTAATGFSASLGATWQLNAAVNYGRERNKLEFDSTITSRVDAALADTNPATALNVFGDGSANNPQTIDSFRGVAIDDGVTTLSSISAVADGPILELPAGFARLAIGMDYRDERLKAKAGRLALATGVFSPFSDAVGNLDRQVSALFSELSVPIIRGVLAARPTLQLSIAGRYEDYSDFGTTFNPKVGLAFVPYPALTLRASWGTSFRAPRFNEISPTANVAFSTAFFNVEDPKSPTGTSDILAIFGAVPDLHEETAEIWTAGFDFAPDSLPGFSASMTYFNYNYEDKIQMVGAADSTLLFEDIWAEFITRDPDPSLVQAICTRSDFDSDCPLAPAAVIDGRIRNLAGIVVKGLDFSISHRWQLAGAGVAAGLSGTRILTYDRTVSSTSPATDVLDTVGNPVSLRLRGSLDLDFGNWRYSFTSNYVDSYRNPVRSPNEVGSWITFNSSIGYEFNKANDSFLSGTMLRLSAVNIFDRDPPFVNQLQGFDSANATDTGRSISVEITKHW